MGGSVVSSQSAAATKEIKNIASKKVLKNQVMAKDFSDSRQVLYYIVFIRFNARKTW